MTDQEVFTTQLVLRGDQIKEAGRTSDRFQEIVLRDLGDSKRAGMWTWVGEVQVIA